ncbi:MAG: hypothetical protein QXP27_07905 [Candidatus Methanomethyliaceae archaeon]
MKQSVIAEIEYVAIRRALEGDNDQMLIFVLKMLKPEGREASISQEDLEALRIIAENIRWRSEQN